MREREEKKALTIICILILMGFGIASCELTGDFREVKADDLKKMIDEEAKILIVDNRSEYEYQTSHIPKAINIPQEQFHALKMLLPKDKSFPIVFYCRGSG